MEQKIDQSAGFSATVSRVVLEYVQAQGQDIAPLMAAMGLRPEQFQDISARVPSVRLTKALQLAQKACGDASAPVRIGALMRPVHAGPLGYALSSAAGSMESLALFERMHRLLCNEFQMRMLPGMDTVEMQAEFFVDMPRDPALWSFIIAAHLSFPRWVVGQDLVPLQVDLPCPQPEDPRAVLAHVGCPIRWDAPCFREVFPVHWLGFRNPNADPQLHEMMMSMADKVWQQHLAMPDELVTQLQQQILTCLKNGEVPSLESVRPMLQGKAFASVRQLQRRLSEQQLSFTDLVESVRRERVLHDLQYTTLNLEEIAQRAAYAEMATLHRAVKRWTGTTPTAFRFHARLTSQADCETA